MRRGPGYMAAAMDQSPWDQDSGGVPLPAEQVSDLIEAFNTHYRKILPKMQPYNNDRASAIMYNPKVVMELIDQYEITLQLLVQNIIFCEEMAMRQMSTKVFIEILTMKNQLLEKLFLPCYDIHLSDFKFGSSDISSLAPVFTSKPFKSSPISQTPQDGRIVLKFAPQISIRQAPILELKSLILNFARMNYPRENAVDFLKNLGPFIRREWITVCKEVSVPSRTKFNAVDDALLLIGLKKMGSKNIDLIKYYFLPDKSTREIKNRYKNLIRKKTSENIIKNWKALQYAPLTELEKTNVNKGIIWFGEENYNKISKYFVPNRSPEYLQHNAVNDKRLLCKREKSRYLFEDQNMEAIAIDLNYDLFQDKRKHIIVEGANGFSPRPAFEEHEGCKVSPLQKLPYNPYEGGAADSSVFNPAIQQGHYRPTGSHNGLGNAGQPGCQMGPNGSFMIRINTSSNFLRNLDDVTLKPKFDRYIKMDLSLDEHDARLPDGKVITLNNKRFRSVKGVLYEIMQEIEEIELLLK